MAIKVKAFEIIDHGIDHSQYFSGCGVSLTEYDTCFTGIGDDPHEALEDALDQAATSGWDIHHIKNKMPHKPSLSDIRDEEEEERRQEAFDQWKEDNPDADDDDCPPYEDEGNDGDERWYYVSIRLKAGPRFTVVEYSSFYAVRDNHTDEEHPMGDGVDTLFTKTGKAMKPGSEYFRRKWEEVLNENESETLEAYFPDQFKKESNE